MRSKEFDPEQLQNYRLISRVLCAINGLKVSDWDLLLYLYPIKYFTRHDFDDGRFTMSWDKKRFYRLINEKWIKKVHDGRGYTGGHSKYALTHKTKILIARLGKIIDGKEDLPEIKNPKIYAHRILNTQVGKFNNNKYIDYESDEWLYG